jgi:hypothetical protein
MPQGKNVHNRPFISEKRSKNKDCARPLKTIRWYVFPHIGTDPSKINSSTTSLVLVFISSMAWFCIPVPKQPEPLCKYPFLNQQFSVMLYIVPPLRLLRR